MVPLNILNNTPPCRKAGKTWSFFQLKDSYGSAQLIARVNENSANDFLDAMSHAPIESAVMVEGVVHARPGNQRRNVSLM